MTQLFSARTLALSLVSAAVLAAAAPTRAASVWNDPATITVIVPTADLDLAGQAGAQTLIARIHGAARAICGVEPAAIQFELHRLYQTCVSGALDRAVAKLDDPVVTATNAGSGHAMAELAANRR